MVQFSRPDSDITVGGWNPNPVTPATLWDKIDETSPNDTDYISSGLSTNNDLAEVGLTDVVDPLDDTGHVMRFRARLGVGTIAASCTFALFQGTTQIKTQSQALTGTPTTYSFTLSSPEASGITDYNDLRFRFTATGIGFEEYIDVTWAELEVPEAILQKVISDSSSASEALSITVTLTISESSVGTELITVSTETNKNIPDSAVGDEAFTFNISFTLTESASGSEDTAITAIPPKITDSAAGSDSISIIHNPTIVKIFDAAKGKEVLTSSRTINVTDKSVGKDIIKNSGFAQGQDMQFIFGGQAPEVFQIEVLDNNDNSLMSFSEIDRSGLNYDNPPTLIWSTRDYNMETYELTWDEKGMSQFRIKVTDPSRSMYDTIRRNHKIKAVLGNPARNLSLSLDFETLAAADKLFDWSGNNNVATLVNMQTGGYKNDVLGWFGRAVEFLGEGFNDGVEVDYKPEFSNPNTLTGIMAIQFDTIGNTAAGNGPMLIQFAESSPVTGYTLQHIGGNTLRFAINDTVLTTWDATWIPLLGEWYVIGFVYNNNTLKFYVDGKEYIATKTAGTMTSITAPTAGTKLKIVGDSFFGAVYAFDGAVDEVALYTKAMTAVQMAEYYQRMAVCPRMYFDGFITELGHENGITEYTALDNSVSMLENEVYDLMFEGMLGAASDPTKPNALIYNKYKFDALPDFMNYGSGSSGTGTDFKTDRVAFDVQSNAAVNTLPFAYMIDYNRNTLLEDSNFVIAPLVIERPTESNIYSVPNDTITIFREDTPGAEAVALKFTATSNTINDVLIKIRAPAFFIPSSAFIKIQIRGEDEDTGIETVIVEDVLNPVFNIANEQIWLWAKWDGVNKFTINSDYWLTVVLSGFTVFLTEIGWMASDGDKVVRRKRGGVWDTDSLAINPTHIIHMEGGYEALSEEDYVIKKADGENAIIAEFGKEDASFLPSGFTMFGAAPVFFKVTYFYSSGRQYASDVINRLLAKIGFTAIYTSTGGRTSRLPTHRLPFYAPQGGTIREHLEQIASLVGETLEVLPGKKVSFVAKAETVQIPNFSFEETNAGGVAGNIKDWTVSVTGGANGALLERSSAARLTGTYAMKHVTATGTVASNTKAYLDIADFDPKPSDAYSNNIELWFYLVGTASLPTNTRFRLVLYDYGTFNNANVLISDRLNGGDFTGVTTWNSMRERINRTAFRLSIELDKPGGDSGQFTLYIDDVRLHHENNTLVIIDPNVKASDYGSNRIPGALKARNVLFSTELDKKANIFYINDIETPPKIEEQMSDKMTNTSIVVGGIRKNTLGFSTGPVIGIARNPASVQRYGERLVIGRQDSLKTDKDAYIRAKSKLTQRFTSRSRIKLIGQYPWLIGRILNLFFPKQGAREPLPMAATEVTMDNSSTEINVNRTFVEEGEDIEKNLQRQKMIEGALFPDAIDAPLYFSYVDLPASISPSAVYSAAFGDAVGAKTPYKTLSIMDRRDTGTPNVWMLKVGKSDGAQWNNVPYSIAHTLERFTHIYFKDVGATLLGSKILLEEFSKMPQMWIVMGVFAT